MNRKLIAFLILGIFLISFISAVCTVILDKTDYVQTETVTAALVCDTSQEKSLSYTLNWTNSTGGLIEQDTGITPATKSELFYEDYILPSNYLGAINASLSGAEMEGVGTANVTALAAGGNSNILVITNSSFGGGYIGSVGSIDAMVKDENGKKISGGRCMISGWSNDESQMILSKETFIVNGDVKADEIMSTERFAEGTQYAYKILCYCGSLGSGTECIDEDGVNVNNSVGSTKGSFETKTWLTVNTVVDKSIYEMKKEIFICVNITNIDYTKRIHIPIRYEARCSAGTDNNQDTDRILIIYDYVLDERGISVNTTQMQCKKFIIPEEPYLMGRNSECYASTEVIVLNEANKEVVSYHTTSSVFNITSDELNLEPDWQWISDTRMNSIVNLSSSSFDDYNGIGIGNIDLQLHASDHGLDILHAWEIFNLIYNITIQNSTSNLTRHVDYELEFTEEDNIEIELRNVNLSKTSGVGWWNITLDFYDFDLRQTEALEGIENKTGTFHLDVNCPSAGTIGGNIACAITAYVEDSQIMQKEVDFTCHISDGTSTYSSVNFNQMITRNAVSISRDFAVPSTFTNGQQYVLQCYADYYNLGSRRDSFYDTFTAAISSGGGGGSAGVGGPGITGGAVDEDGEDEFEIPLSPEDEGFYLFWIVALFIVLIIISFLVILIIRRRKSAPSHKKIDGCYLKITLKIFLILIIILGLVFGGIYLFRFIWNSFGNEIVSLEVIPQTYSLLFDKLFRGIVLAFFIVLMIILLFRSLRIRGEVRFGEEHHFSRIKCDRKSSRLQRRLNHMILKRELKSTKRHSPIKVRKLKHKKS
jgi:hypothetical protein